MKGGGMKGRGEGNKGEARTGHEKGEQKRWRRTDSKGRR